MVAPKYVPEAERSARQSDRKERRGKSGRCASVKWTDLNIGIALQDKFPDYRPAHRKIFTDLREGASARGSTTTPNLETNRRSSDPRWLGTKNGRKQLEAFTDVSQPCTKRAHSSGLPHLFFANASTRSDLGYCCRREPGGLVDVSRRDRPRENHAPSSTDPAPICTTADILTLIELRAAPRSSLHHAIHRHTGPGRTGVPASRMINLSPPVIPCATGRFRCLLRARDRGNKNFNFDRDRILVVAATSAANRSFVAGLRSNQRVDSRVGRDTRGAHALTCSRRRRPVSTAAWCRASWPRRPRHGAPPRGVRASSYP